MRVFTKKQISEKHIPLPGQFLEVKRMLAQGFSTVYASQLRTDNVHLLGAVLIGSMARQVDMACTSDIDIVAFYDSDLADDASLAVYAQLYRGCYMEALEKACMYNVPTKIYNVFSSKLTLRETRYTKQFLKHAITSMYGFGGKTPSGLLAGNPEKVQAMFQKAPSLTTEKAIEYIAGKQEKLRDRYFSLGGLSENDQVSMYADLFNAPFHASRQVLDVIGMPYTDTKSEVIDEIEKLSPKTAEKLQHIAHEAISYGKECELYRDDRQNVIKRPFFLVDRIYNESYTGLSELWELIGTR